MNPLVLSLLEQQRLLSEIMSLLALRENPGGMTLAEIDAQLEALFAQYAFATVDLLFGVKALVNSVVVVTPVIP